MIGAYLSIISSNFSIVLVISGLLGKLDGLELDQYNIYTYIYICVYLHMEYKERGQWEYFNFGRYRGIPLPVWSYILPLQQTETRMSNGLHVENIECTCALGYHVDMHYCVYP